MLDGPYPIVIPTNRGPVPRAQKFSQDYHIVARENRTFLPMDQNLQVAR